MRPGLFSLLGSIWLSTIVLVLSVAAADSTGTIAGTVRGVGGEPLSGTTILVEDTDPPRSAVSDSTGQFLIRDVPVGTRQLRIKTFGWWALQDTVVVRIYEVTRVDYVLNRDPLPRTAGPVIGRGFSSDPPLLVESYPRGTTLDSDLPDAADVWRQMFASANRWIDIAEFYVSDNPTDRSDLTAIFDTIKSRAHDGVQVRLLVEEKFYKTYPTWVNQLDSLDNVESRRLDYASIAGGVLHAKYFVVDGQLAYMGSQNFDWRALEHIQELGVVLNSPASLHGLNTIFKRDWARGVPIDTKAPRRPDVNDPTPELEPGFESTSVGGDTLTWQLLASPKDDLPPGVAWDLPRLIEMIDSARDSIAVQLLTYKPRNRTGEMWDELDGALRRAAKRGVAVRLLLSNWGKRTGTVEHLQELSQVPGFELRFMNIPEWSGGFIPFARTVHAKYMVVDGERFWLGTSNWEKDYFYSSRNVGIVGDGRALGAELSQFFRNGWDSVYSEAIRADVTYEAPRIAE